MATKRRQEPARRRRALKKSATQIGPAGEYVPATPIRAAFWARASAALKRIAERADESSLQRALAAPPDAGALPRAISDYSWGGAALAFLVAPDDQLGGLSPLKALQRNAARLREPTLRLARAAAGDGFS